MGNRLSGQKVQWITWSFSFLISVSITSINTLPSFWALHSKHSHILKNLFCLIWHGSLQCISFLLALPFNVRAPFSAALHALMPASNIWLFEPRSFFEDTATLGYSLSGMIWFVLILHVTDYSGLNHSRALAPVTFKVPIVCLPCFHFLCLLVCFSSFCYIDLRRWSEHKPLLAAGSDLKHVTKYKYEISPSITFSFQKLQRFPSSH